MRHARLFPHPDTPCLRVESIDVSIEVQAGVDLRLTYTVSGDIASLLIPPAAPPQRSDGLWQHTCFEAFVLAGNGPGYREFNFSPSGEWAAYIFCNYRDGCAPGAMPAPAIACRTSANALELTAMLPRLALPDGRRWTLGLTAVIESVDEKLSYWALRHPVDKPDFHHTGGFALEVERA